MAVKMRNNNNKDAVCCSCGESQKQVLNMFDMCVGKNIFTICDCCTDKIFNKCLLAICTVNSRVKSQTDISIINKRKKRQASEEVYGK